MFNFGKEFQEILQLYPNHTKMAGSGHIDIMGDLSLIREKVIQELASFRNNNQPILFFCGMAPGADQLLASCLQEEDVLVIVDALPPEEMKLQSFSSGSPEENEISYQAYLSPSNEIVHRIQLYENNEVFETLSDAQHRFREQAECMVAHTDILMVLWDGVDTGAPGGTSDIVACWNKPVVPAKPKQLLQLIVPRQKNPFPVARLFEHGCNPAYVFQFYDWVKTTRLPREKPSFPDRVYGTIKKYAGWVSILVLLTFMLTSLFLVSGFRGEDVFLLPILALAFTAAFLAYRHYREGRMILLQFVYPVSLAVLILFFGTIGASELFASAADAFFFAANLITLGASNFNDLSSPVNHWLQAGRMLGAMLAGYAFLLAFALAVGKENISRLHFWLYRMIRPSARFDVIFGDGLKSILLAEDLEKKGRRLVLLDAGTKPELAERAGPLKIWYIKGTHTAVASLKQTYFHKAENLYLLYEQDEDNFRAAQRLTELERSQRKHPSGEWYVHLEQENNRNLLQNFANRYYHTGNVRAHTARRLLARFPPDRFHSDEDQRKVMVVLFGWNLLSEEIVLTAIRQGIYTHGRTLGIRVYYEREHKADVLAFREKHPELFDDRASNGMADACMRYSFGLDAFPIVVFEPMPEAASGLSDPGFSFYDLVRPDHIVTVYANLSSALSSAALLSSLLPRTAFLRNGNKAKRVPTDIIAGCFCDLPDGEEEREMEQSLNRLVPHIPIFCFGNPARACGEEAIQQKAPDRLAKRIALLYAVLYNDMRVLKYQPALREHIRSVSEKINKESGNHTRSFNETQQRMAQELASAFMENPSATDAIASEAWKCIAQEERESNQYAADHAWVKLRLLRKQHPDGMAKQELFSFWNKEELKLLAEVEHRRWNAEKLTLGWLPYDGLEWKKNKVELKKHKLHEHLVPFSNLPASEKDKDYTQVLGIPFLMRDLY